MKRTTIIEISAVFIVLVLLFFLDHFNKDINKEIFRTGKLAIGVFIRFDTQFVGFSRSYYYYYYNELGIKFSPVNSENMPNSNQRKNIKEGDCFLVIYDENGSSIFFDKPIKDSIDFKKYNQEFEQMRKQKTKE